MFMLYLRFIVSILCVVIFSWAYLVEDIYTMLFLGIIMLDTSLSQILRRIK